MAKLNGWKRNRFRAVSASLSCAALGLGLTLIHQSAASAQAAYGSYIGVGGSFGLSDGGPGEDSSSGGVVAFRYRVLEAPISLRAQALIGDATAIVPTVSLDFPLDFQTDAYVGAGVALQDSDTDTSPVGNQTSFVIQPGIEHAFTYSDLVIFGNAVIAFDAYRGGGGTATAIQAGLGLNFGR
jgi:opacity protein-like surface antigen